MAGMRDVIIAYLILAHHQPEQLKRLVAALPARSPVYIHIDGKVPTSEVSAMKAAVADRPLTAFVERHICHWGDAGIVEATFDLIHAALAGEPFDYGTLLSGSDYPIKTGAHIERFLDARAGSEFIEIFDMLQPNRWSEAPGKFKAPERATRWHIRRGRSAIRLPIPRRLPFGMTPYGGSQWWTLSRAALAYVDDFVAAHPRFRRFLRGVYIPDEFAVQTIIGNSPFLERCANDDLRLVIWDRPTPPYPAVIVSADLELLRKSDRLFARKCDDRTDPLIYDLIDRELRDAAAE
jgi:hypothetical protein